MDGTHSTPLTGLSALIAVAGTVLGCVGSAHATTNPKYAVSLASENLSSVVISAGAAGQPNTPQSVCAVVTEIDTVDCPTIQTGETVSFSIQNAPSKWTLSAGSAAANGSGQAIITIQANTGGAAASDTLIATYTDTTVTPPRNYTATLPVYAKTASCTFTTNDPTLGWGKIPNPCSIPWVYTGSHFATIISNAITQWQNTGLVKFTAGAAPPNTAANSIVFEDTCQPSVSWYAVTCNPNDTTAPCNNPNNYYEICMNVPNMDGLPAGCGGSCNSDNPPASASHQNVYIPVHEVGHALDLAHNATDVAALMYQNNSMFWLCGTVAPTVDETNTMKGAPDNYTPCP